MAHGVEQVKVLPDDAGDLIHLRSSVELFMDREAEAESGIRLPRLVRLAKHPTRRREIVVPRPTNTFAR